MKTLPLHSLDIKWTLYGVQSVIFIEVLMIMTSWKSCFKLNWMPMLYGIRRFIKRRDLILFVTEKSLDCSNIQSSRTLLN
jgi:hypothetical protein